MYHLSRMRAAVVLFAAIVAAAGCRDAAVVSVRPQATDEIVLTIEVSDHTPADAMSVSAFAIHIDGRPVHDVLVVPGRGRTSYETLIGPLSGEEHTVQVKPSQAWPPHPTLRVTGVSVRTISAAEPEYEALRLAPAVVLRPDTVGTSSDQPMLMYAERRDGGRALRYTTIFTNEDGGTDTRALFARWGRACDIEETYAVTLDQGRTIAETFQGPEHKITPFNGSRIGAHPVLAVATRNNMFVDTGAAGVMIRPVPIVVPSGFTTRESVLDDRPWLQRLTARELAAEKKPFDPRDFVYLEADVQVGPDASTAAWVDTADRQRVSSDRGDERLTVTRDGWVRVAVPLARGSSVVGAGWHCLPREGRKGPCQIKPGRVFGLSDDFQVREIAVGVRSP
jgi:hypothetical protein